MNNINQGKFSVFLQLLNLAELVIIDGSPQIKSWELEEPTGDELNEVVRFSWTDEGEDFSVILNEGGIQNGTFTQNGFQCEDHIGEQTNIQFFSLEEISPFTLSSDVLNVQAAFG